MANFPVPFASALLSTTVSIRIDPPAVGGGEETFSFGCVAGPPRARLPRSISRGSFATFIAEPQGGGTCRLIEGSLSLCESENSVISDNLTTAMKLSVNYYYYCYIYYVIIQHLATTTGCPPSKQRKSCLKHFSLSRIV